MDFFQRLFETDFMPHGHCYFWRPEILWPHVLGDLFTALSYFIIPLLLYRFVKARPDVKYPYVFLAFSLFILFCGITHALSIVSVWHPIYRMEAVAKVATAAVSMGTVGLLFTLYKPILAIPSAQQWEQANQALRQEIEQRKSMEQQLLARERNFRTIMDYAPVGMATVDLQGKWTSVNPALCRILGYTEQELLTRDFSSITHPDDLEQGFAAMDKMLKGQEEGVFLQKRYLHKSGRPIWGLLGVTLIRNEHNEPLYFIAQINDVTQQVEAQQRIAALNTQLEEKVRLRTAQLEEMNEELEHFTYTVSHDLRSPLKNINGLLQMFEDTSGAQLDEDGQSIIHHVRRSAERMDRLISHFLSFSRLGQQMLDQEVVDVEKMFQKVLEELRQDYANKQIAFQLGALPTAYADKLLIRQVVENLLSNALKYAADKETIEIEVSGWTTADQVVYKVSDNGVGFSPEAQYRLFQMFQRLHAKDQFSGHGIGLAFSERIVKKHGGKIWAESEPGQGASFFFSLPLQVV